MTPEPDREAAPPFGPLLKRLRLAARLSQEALAERAGVSPQAVSALESGARRVPHHDTVDRLAVALHLSPAERSRLEAAASRFQAGAGGSPVTASSRHNLLAPPTQLIGRERERAEIKALLRRIDVRLVTLTGPGGVGKSRLAHAVAAEVLIDFPDGVWFVALDALADLGLLLASIALVLGVQEAPGQGIFDGIRTALQGRRVLLILDSFERLLTQAVVVADLLAAAPRLMVLATSRAVLSLAAEYAYPLAPLAIPPPSHRADPSSLSRFEAVALFAERAAASGAGFALTDENALAVAELCRRMDGLPLAIELAAAQTKVLPPQAILARLARRLPLPTGGPRDRPERQRTLRATIAWSYDLLTAAERRILRQFAVFTGSCSLEAIEAILGATPGDVLDGLGTLVDHSLLRRETTPQGEARFSYLETIREYAHERLEESGEAEAVRRRHADYYRALAEAAETKFAGPEQGIWLERLADERDNLRAALAWSMAPGGDPLLGAQLAAILAWYWYVNGQATEGRRWLEACLAAPPPGLPVLLRAKLLGGAGTLAWTQGDYATARSRLEGSVILLRELDEPRWLAIALTLCGRALASQGAGEAAVSLYRESLQLTEEVGAPYWRAVTLHALGAALEDRGDTAAAVALYEESLALFRALGERGGQGLAVGSLAGITAAQGQVDQARAYYAEAAAALAHGDPFSLAATRASIAWFQLRQGEATAAAVAYRECLAIWHDIGYLPGVVTSLIGLARAAAANGDHRRAGRLLAVADAAFVPSGIHTMSLGGSDYQAFQRAVQAERAQADGPAFDAGWADGRLLPLDEVVAALLVPADKRQANF